MITEHATDLISIFDVTDSHCLAQCLAGNLKCFSAIENDAVPEHIGKPATAASKCLSPILQLDEHDLDQLPSELALCLTADALCGDKCNVCLHAGHSPVPDAGEALLNACLASIDYSATSLLLDEPDGDCAACHILQPDKCARCLPGARRDGSPISFSASNTPSTPTATSSESDVAEAKAPVLRRTQRTPRRPRKRPGDDMIATERKPSPKARLQDASPKAARVQEASRKSETDIHLLEADGRKHAAVHKEMERQRRLHLRHSLDRLRAVLGLPSDSVEVHVLTAALACIQKLEQEFKSITEETDRIRALQG